jgi:hypothetical protein
LSCHRTSHIESTDHSASMRSLVSCHQCICHDLVTPRGLE